MSEADAADSANKSTLRSSPTGVRAKYHAARAPILWVTVVCAAFAVGLIAAASVTVVATRNKTLSDGTGDLSRLGLAIATHTHRIIFGADLIISDLEQRFISAGKISADGFVEYAGTKSMNGLLHDMVVISSDLDTLVMIDRHGKLINSSLSGPTPAIDLSDRDYFINLRDNPDLGYFISEPLKNRGTGQDGIFLAHRINGSDGAFVGIILGSISTSRFEKLFGPMLPSSDASISLYRRDGTLLSRQPQLESPGEQSQAIQQVFARTLAGAEQGTLRTRAFGDKGIAQIVALHTVPGYRLVVTAADSEDVVLSSWRQLALLISAVTAGAILLLAIGGYLIGRQFRMQTQVEEARAHQERSDRAREIAETAERIQASAREELKSIMDHASDGLISVNQGGAILNFSVPAENIFGHRADEVIGHDVKMLLAEPDRLGDNGQSDSCVAADKLRGDLEGRRKDGSTFPMELAIAEIAHDAGLGRYVVTVRDVTERKAAQAMLRHSQKMDAIGQLTGGIAHDFNNILTVITGTVEILAEDLADRPELVAIAKMIDDAATRGASLTRELLAFARKQPLEPRDVDVNTLIMETVTLLRPTLGEHIEIEVMPGANIWRAMADPSQLSAALLNLAINARDAMPNGGKLTFESGESILDEAYAMANPDAEPGAYVMIAVSDTGTGIAAALLDRVFEPFFTTKETGKGTGLGLSMVYGFVKQSRGHIKIYSEVGHGTTIRVYFPRSVGPSYVKPAMPDVGTLPGGTETIRVVEDDELVRTYVLAQLRSLGYTTLSAGNAGAALALVDQEGVQVDLLFTDVIMPGGMNGRQLADEVKSRRPAAKVLFTSGYTENAIIHHGRLDPGVNLLVKPYRKADLARKIREVLAAP